MVGGGGNLKIFARKREGVLIKQNGEGALSQNGDCHIILRFFLRFLVMQLRKKILMCLSFLC